MLDLIMQSIFMADNTPYSVHSECSPLYLVYHAEHQVELSTEKERAKHRRPRATARRLGVFRPGVILLISGLLLYYYPFAHRRLNFSLSHFIRLTWLVTIALAWMLS